MLWIPIRSDLQNFSGSVRYPHPQSADPDLFPFQPKLKLMFQYFVQNIENYDTYDADEWGKLALLWINSGYGRILIGIKMESRIWIRIGIKIENRLRILIGIKTMPIQNNGPNLF